MYTLYLGNPWNSLYYHLLFPHKLRNLSRPAWNSRRLFQHRSCKFSPWVEKIPWKREWLATPVLWPGELHELFPWGGKESDITEQLSLSLHTKCWDKPELSAVGDRNTKKALLAWKAFTINRGGKTQSKLSCPKRRPRELGKAQMHAPPGIIKWCDQQHGHVTAKKDRSTHN